MSKWCPSTFTCAFSIVFVIILFSRGVSSSMPDHDMIVLILSPAKRFIRSSSNET